jgi:hypothetical protein
MLPTRLADRVVMRFEMFLAFAMNRQTGSVQFSSYEGQQALNVNFPSLPFPSRPFTSLPQASQPSSLSGASDRETLSCAGSATLVHACRTQPAGSLRGGDPHYLILQYSMVSGFPCLAPMSCPCHAPIMLSSRRGEAEKVTAPLLTGGFALPPCSCPSSIAYALVL